MPAVAVVAAVASAVTVAEVGFAALSAFEIVGAVGAMASGLGVVTGSKDLMKVGGAMAVVGGVGAFASNPSGFMQNVTDKVSNIGDSISKFINGESVAMGDVVPTTGNVDVGGETTTTVSGGSDPTSAFNDVQKSTGNIAQQTNNINDAISGNGNGLINGGGNQLGEVLDKGSTQVTGPLSDVLDKGSTSLTGTGADSIYGPSTDLASNAMGPAQSWQKPLGNTNILDKIADMSKGVMNWAKQDKLGSAMLMKGIFGIAETQTDAYKLKNQYMQAAANNANANSAMTNQQLANMNYAPNVSNQFALNPNFQPFGATNTYKAPNVGLINTVKA